jgi:esterase/lipase superfamily enzyme
MTGLARITMAVAMGLALVSCGGRPNGVLIPVAQTAPGASVVDVLVTTTRSDENVPPAQMFSGERGRGMGFAEIAVSIPPDASRKIGEIQWPSSLPGNPATDFVTVRADRLDREQAISQLDARLRKTPHRRVLLFVHGFNTRFEEAVYRFAQIVHDGKTPVVPVLFTWPSRGRLLAYGYDRESANYSRYALETVLQFLSKDKNVNEVVVLAHSMGNWVALEALRTMAIRDGRISPKITSVMLAAPDVDFDVFRRQIAEIGEKRPPFIIFTSQDDEALAISRRIWGSSSRLGQVNPNVEPYRTELERAHVTVVDLTGVQSGDALNHGTFAQSPEVVQLIGRQLASGQTLTDGKASFGETLGLVVGGAAATVGSAAAIAVSAPVAIVDPRARESLGDQFQQFGTNATTIVKPSQ